MPANPHTSGTQIPEHPHESWDASRFEDGEQPLTVVGEVVQDAGGAAGSVQVTGVLHGAHHSSHDLRGLHQGPARGLFLGELIHYHGCFADDNLGVREAANRRKSPTNTLIHTPRQSHLLPRHGTRLPLMRPEGKSLPLK